jgi:putative spermidine/putrescine transport system permease protein
MSLRRIGLVVLVVAALAPIAMLIVRAIAPAWPFPLLLPVTAGDVALPGSSRLISAATTGIALSLAVGVISTPLALIASRALARSSLTVRTMGQVLAFLPVVAPPVSLGIGVTLAAMRLHMAGTWSGVLFAHVLPATGYATLFLTAALDRYEFAAEDVARTLGASPLKVLRYVVIPSLRSRIFEAFALAALVSWGQLALTLLIGEGAIRTIPVELLAFVGAGDDRLGALSALALMVPPLVGFVLLQRSTARTGVA